MSATGTTHHFGPRMRRSSRGLKRAMILAMSLLAVLLAPVSSDALDASELSGATVYVVNVETGRYLDGDRDGAVRQSQIPNQDDQWVMDEVRPGVFSFRNVEIGRLLDGDGAGRDYDVNLSSNLEADTEWQLVALGDGVYEITNVRYGLWLDADKGFDYNVNLSPNGDDDDAHWYIALANPTPDQLDGATVLIASAATGLWLDGDTDTVDQSIAPRLDDHWVVEQVGRNVTFRGVENDRLLTGDEDDVNLDSDGGINSEWRLRQRSNGTYEIRNVDTQLWLDADYANKDFNVDLTPNVHDIDANWNILVIDTDLGCVTETLATINHLLRCVDASDSFVHMRAFQSFADQSGGIRASGTLGYDLSADYVAELLEEAGMSVERQVFDFSLFTANSQSIVADGVAVEEVQAVSFAASGQVVDGTVTAVDLDLGLGNTSTSGCEPEDFVVHDLSGPADIALVQRGACDFSTKALNAQDAGAEAVVIFNQGDTEDRFGPIQATLGAGAVGTIVIPVLDVGYDDGVALADAALVSVALDASTVTQSTENVIADLAGVNPNNVVMAGAHLDSVVDGPGIQDNGSGSAVLLSIALALANNETYVPQNTLRFAWWGAEEAGLIGSDEYVFNPEFGLTEDEYNALALYLNFDMVASPNFIYGVYDADQSTFEPTVPVPDGSAALEDLFEAYYTLEGVPYDDSEFSGRSDYQAFISVGIPASGLFTGAEGIKTEEQASIWGGTAGEQYDPCYHIACDTIDNPSFEALEVNTDAIAYAIYILASSTESVNGVEGVEVQGTTPDEITLDGSQRTFAGGGGGLSPHADDHDHDHATS